MSPNFEISTFPRSLKAWSVLLCYNWYYIQRAKKSLNYICCYTKMILKLYSRIELLYRTSQADSWSHLDPFYYICTHTFKFPWLSIGAARIMQRASSVCLCCNSQRYIYIGTTMISSTWFPATSGFTGRRFSSCYPEPNQEDKVDPTHLLCLSNLDRLTF